MIYKPIKRQNSISTILSIVLAINGVYTKTSKFHHRHAYRSSRIGHIMTTSGLPIVCGYSTHCTKYISFPTNCLLNFGLLGVLPVSAAAGTHILYHFNQFVSHASHGVPDMLKYQSGHRRNWQKVWKCHIFHPEAPKIPNAPPEWVMVVTLAVKDARTNTNNMQRKRNKIGW